MQADCSRPDGSATNFERRKYMEKELNQKIPSVCFIDTEFNALDYIGQNDGFQEITEIGAVVFQNGKPAAKFQKYCKILSEHTISKRSTKITGITQEDLDRDGVPFNKAMAEFLRFLRKYNIQTVYAFGTSDRIELWNTAKLNGRMGPQVYNMIKDIRDVYPSFVGRLRLGNESFSLSDICVSCNVDHTARAHSALSDAEDTGLAYYNMRHDNINREYLEKIKIHKKNVGLYNRSRRIPSPAAIPFEDDGFLKELEQAFSNNSIKCSPPVLTALHDDLMCILGRPDLVYGEKNL